MDKTDNKAQELTNELNLQKQFLRTVFQKVNYLSYRLLMNTRNEVCYDNNHTVLDEFKELKEVAEEITNDLVAQIKKEN